MWWTPEKRNELRAALSASYYVAVSEATDISQLRLILFTAREISLGDNKLDAIAKVINFKPTGPAGSQP